MMNEGNIERVPLPNRRMTPVQLVPKPIQQFLNPREYSLHMIAET